ncbi:MAG: LysR family transcriptional regulator [Rhodocyclaceae bacterium]|nr:LysR family transcriptional regulator [Rhodocyclaceae bacterium]
MNWDDLRYVLAVARQRTLAGAGRELGVDPTTVGRRLLAIEGQLGARLFERTGEGFTANAAGQIAVARAAEVELQTSALERELQGNDSRVAGPVRITALDVLLDNFVIPRLPRLWQRHRGLELTLVSGLRVLDLSRHEADIAIRAIKPTHPDAIARRLGSVATAAYVSRAVELGDAPPLVGFPRDLDDTAIDRALREHFPSGRLVARANTEGHVLELVRAGVGVGLVDCFAGDADPGLRRARLQPVLQSEMWAVVHADMRGTARVRAVMDFLTEIIAEEADLLEGRRPTDHGRP